MSTTEVRSRVGKGRRASRNTTEVRSRIGKGRRSSGGGRIMGSGDVAQLFSKVTGPPSTEVRSRAGKGRRTMRPVNNQPIMSHDELQRLEERTHIRRSKNVRKTGKGVYVRKWMKGPMPKHRTKWVHFRHDTSPRILNWRKEFGRIAGAAARNAFR